MSLFDSIASAEVEISPKDDFALVDYKGAPSLFKKGTYDPNMRTIAYRNPADKPSAPGEATRVYEIDLLPGLNEIPLDVWTLVKPNLGDLLKPGRRLIVIPLGEIEIKNGEETMHREEWVKEKPLMVECGKWSTLDADKAAYLIDRCVSEPLLDKFEKRFGKEETVRDAIAVQRQLLDSAVVKR